ncbi:hypothetical protein CYMTET_44367 [Cymbomonas tetramitiformis]|uniref:Uncharacterized protein n=1 Tax=Cymbomonas tetramitiformis TaxID=36881 RepID=A0AAE0C0D4_9CHLO|nr:hypothetical protein CYMTET_44367 [Cymbomonas tetramitiformis]
MASEAKHQIMICTAEGILNQENVDILRDRLQAICKDAGEPLEVHEICIRSAKFDGVPRTDLRLLKFTDASADAQNAWIVRQQGKKVTDHLWTEKLRSTVNSVLESYCSGDALQFFSFMGFSQQFEFLRRGTQYACTESGTSILVSTPKHLRVFTFER